MKRSRILSFIAVLFIIVGIALLLKDPIQNYLIKEVVAENNYSTLSVKDVRENEQLEGEFDFDQTVSVDFEQVMTSYQNRTQLAVIGGIAIPSIELNLPILKGVSNENLIGGAGTMTSEQKMGQGNYGLVSHNVVRPRVLFSDVQDMEIGDLIYLTDMEKIYVYEVDRVEMISPTQVEVIEEVPGKEMVTLVTCSDDILMRWVVQGNLVTAVDRSEATQEMADALGI